MKNKFRTILAMSFILCITSCGINYDGKNIEDMSLIELNSYNDDLKSKKENVLTKNNDYKEASDGKVETEIIEMINYINTEIVKSNVMITNESRGFFHTNSVSSGSGTIIKEDERYYYILTNNHVIYSLGQKSLYYVYDYLNNEYNAVLLFSDPNYDMALLKVEKKREKLRVSKIATTDVNIGDNIVAIGQPLGQRNAITFGEVLKYDYVNCDNCNPLESNIQYECIYYDAPTNNGNSGGMLINYDYELVGVVTYGLNASNGDYLYGAGSSSSKIREFLTNNAFEVGDSND